MILLERFGVPKIPIVRRQLYTLPKAYGRRTCKKLAKMEPLQVPLKQKQKVMQTVVELGEYTTFQFTASKMSQR